MEERLSVEEELRNDISNFRKRLRPELDYLIHKYKPSDVEIFCDNESGRQLEVGIKLIFE